MRRKVRVASYGTVHLVLKEPRVVFLWFSAEQHEVVVVVGVYCDEAPETSSYPVFPQVEPAIFQSAFQDFLSSGGSDQLLVKPNQIYATLWKL
mmetsp:Transcript_18696/g.25353  ORF Transcript_18696/g.25353 Transcript_18696/m.25353 type:complete len:93 (-) Transcript_18696:39-317(-)